MQVRLKYTALFAVTVVLLLATIFFMSYKEVALAVDGRKKVIATRAMTVAAFLNSQHIKFSPHDEVQPAPETLLLPGTTIKVRHKIPVVVKLGNQVKVVLTSADNVNTLLRKMNIKTEGDILVSPLGFKALEPGMTVSVANLRRRLETVDSNIAYAVKKVDDPGLLKGRTKIAVRGGLGIRRKVIEHVYAGNREIECRLKSDKIVKQPVAKVVKVGTKTPQLASAAVRPATYQGNVSRGGRSMFMVATGYATGDGGGAGARTATGTGVHRGIVAVDPRVIPLGTRLYIEGYGPAVAADTGGAIKGNRIDLGFSSVGEALRWGRRGVTVHITP